METYPNVHDILELTNLDSTESVEARVVAMRGSSPEAQQGIGIELLVASETFWGMNFQLIRSTAALHTLEQNIQADGIDLRLLRQFRDEVDRIRRAAWTIEERERHRLQQHGQQDGLPLLISERIHCATRLCNELAAELESHKVSFKTKGIAEFNRAIDRIRECLERSVLPLDADTGDGRRFPRV